MPSSAREDLKTALTAGGVVGGFIGLIVFIWSAIKFINPALQEHGFSGIQASFITLGISLGIGVELAVSLGVLYGVIKALILFAIIHYSMKCFAGSNQHALSDTHIESGLGNSATKRALAELSVQKSHAREDNVETKVQNNKSAENKLKEKERHRDAFFDVDKESVVIVIEDSAHKNQPTH